MFAIFSPRFFDGMDAAYVAVYRGAGGEPWRFALLRIALAALCLLPPTLLMGGTLPLVVRGLRRPSDESVDRGDRGNQIEQIDQIDPIAEIARDGVGRDTALLYGANTLGAVCGVAGAGFLTIPLFGLRASLLISAALNFAAALGALALARRPGRPAPGTKTQATPAPAVPRPGARALLVAAALMGATSLAFEVLWTRILVFYLGSSVYAFSLMLLGFLLGVALGSLAIGRLVDRLANPLALLAGVELAIAATAPLSIWLFATLNGRQIALSETLHPQGFGTAVVAQLVAVLPVLLPPTLLMGVSFPLLVRIYAAGRGRIGSDLGELYGANTLGCIVGSLGAGFGLIPLLGTQRSLLAVGRSAPRPPSSSRRVRKGGCATWRSRRRSSFSLSPSGFRPTA